MLCRKQLFSLASRGSSQVIFSTTGEMKNSNKIILDLCGGTGAWSKPYTEAGYTVYNITLPEWNVGKVTFGEGTITFIHQASGFPLMIRYKDIYGILAAPPCIEFSRAKSTKPRDFEKGMKTIEACMRIVWEVQKRKKIEFWALENPMGLLRRFLGNPPYNFNQWWFGNDRTKNTDLWGKFKIPRRRIFQSPIYLSTTKGYINKKGEKLANRNPKWYSNISAKNRAITPAGFAKEFFKANQ